MKPFDGGAWVGVSRITDAASLNKAYDESGQRLMHLQASVEGYDSFARSLTIGAETMVMKFRPELPMHDRYAVAHDFLPPSAGLEVLAISKLINAFFRWEFNSCESLVVGDEVHPIDYANACPDIAITSLHYYFPWAISALLKWSAFCAVTEPAAAAGHRTPGTYFDVADSDLSYGDKLAAYAALADEHFEKDRYEEFCATSLASLDEIVRDWVASPEFDALLVDTVEGHVPRPRAGPLRLPLPRAAGSLVADNSQLGMLLYRLCAGAHGCCDAPVTRMRTVVTSPGRSAGGAGGGRRARPGGPRPSPGRCAGRAVALRPGPQGLRRDGAQHHVQGLVHGRERRAVRRLRAHRGQHQRRDAAVRGDRRVDVHRPADPRHDVHGRGARPDRDDLPGHQHPAPRRLHAGHRLPHRPAAQTRWSCGPGCRARARSSCSSATTRRSTATAAAGPPTAAPTTRPSTRPPPRWSARTPTRSPTR